MNLDDNSYESVQQMTPQEKVAKYQECVNAFLRNENEKPNFLTLYYLVTNKHNLPLVMDKTIPKRYNATVPNENCVVFFTPAPNNAVKFPVVVYVQKGQVAELMKEELLSSIKYSELVDAVDLETRQNNLNKRQNKAKEANKTNRKITSVCRRLKRNNVEDDETYTDSESSCSE